MNAAIGMWRGLLLASLVAAGAAHAANNAAFVSQSVPTVMVPGQTYAVSVTMQNNGTTTWTAASNHRLGTLYNNWGIGRILLPGSAAVAPGQNYTFSFNVTAPSTPGTYNFQWRMVEEWVEWFGASSTNVVVKNGLNDASFVSQTVPTVTAPGQSYPVSVTMQNTGGSTWTPGTNYRLGSQNHQDNTRWGTNRVYLPASVTSVPPGANVTFTFNATAPSTVGTHNFQWRMVQDGVEWFGGNSANVAVKNGLNDASFVSQAVPTVMTPGQTYAVSVTMQNSGGSTWTAARNHRLGALDNTWGISRIMLPGSAAVAPGQNYTFSFNVTAPSTPGTYNFQWRMVEEWVEWFGPNSPNLAIKVGLDDAQFISQDVPTLVAPGQTYPVSVTMRNSGTSTWAAGSAGLGSQNPANNTTWGFNRVLLANAVAPGANATFTFSITAPTAPGPYNFQWRMAEGDLGWFGASTPNVAVQNGWEGAEFVSQSVPAAMNPGQTYPVSVTMQNTGSIPWTPGTYRLGSQNPQDNTVWGLSRVELPASVAPGANVTFAFNALAPAASGPYNFQWRMLKDASDWIGPSSSNVAVSVGTLQANMFFIHVDHLNTPRLVADAAGTTVWKWDQQEPFGVNVPDENPSGLGSFEFPMRFPGQYFDRETNLAYNSARDYDPGIGRYVQSDPIGLTGGINTYAYVNLNPLSFIDRFGLAGDDIGDGARPRGPVGVPNPSADAQRDLARWLARLFCPPDCWELQGLIKERANELRERYFRMLNDPKDLYRKAYCEPSLGRRIGTWLGHGDQITQQKKNLADLIAKADAMNCPVDPQDRDLLRIEPPECPAAR